MACAEKSKVELDISMYIHTDVQLVSGFGVHKSPYYF